MKQPKKPTRDQKKLMSKAELEWKAWSVESETETELNLISKRTGQKMTIKKEER